MGVDSSVEPPGLVVTLVAGKEGSWTVCWEVLEAAPLNWKPPPAFILKVLKFDEVT